MISRGTPYQLARRSQVFTMSGQDSDDMTSLSVRILERIHKEKGMEGCSLIGDVNIVGLPKRPSGETHIRVELGIEEDSGIVKGTVEDIGYKEIHAPSGFKESFVPMRHERIMIKGER
jgi:molecular chaperone DnaK (HSP70)